MTMSLPVQGVPRPTGVRGVRGLRSCLGAVFFETLTTEIQTPDGDVRRHETLVALGMDEGGNQEVLGFWVGTAWPDALDELAHRGAVDIGVVCLRDPADVEDAFHTAFPGMVVVANVAALLADAQLSGAHEDAAPLTAAIGRIFLAARTAEAAHAALTHLANTPLGQNNRQCLQAIATRWQSVVPYFGLSRSMRTTLYSHGSDPLVRQLQELLDTRRFRDAVEVVNTLWLAVSSQAVPDAENPAQRRCSRPGCGNLFSPNKRGRPREFCSEGCRRMHWDLEQRWNEPQAHAVARSRTDPTKLAEQLSVTAKLLLETAQHLQEQLRV